MATVRRPWQTPRLIVEGLAHQSPWVMLYHVLEVGNLLLRRVKCNPKKINRHTSTDTCFRGLSGSARFSGALRRLAESPASVLPFAPQTAVPCASRVALNSASGLGGGKRLTKRRPGILAGTRQIMFYNVDR